MIDRIIQGGYVTDFIKMGVPGVYYWPNYNIADSAIVVGVIGLGIFIVWDDLHKQRQVEPESAGDRVNAEP
jgi:signal peptidase II